MEVLYKLVEPAEVDYRAVSSLLFRNQEQSAVKVFFEKGIAFIAPIDRSLFTSASTRGTVKSEHFVTGTCN